MTITDNYDSYEFASYGLAICSVEKAVIFLYLDTMYFKDFCP